MDGLEEISDRILEYLEKKNNARDHALKNSRATIRHCSTAIRAIHRQERETALADLAKAKTLLASIKADLEPYPDLYHAGYTQDAQKEYAEANIVLALIWEDPLPSPEQLAVEYAAYLGGLAEAAGELRRRTLDVLRQGDEEQAERLLASMDEIYGLLVTVDFPDAITGNLRRTTDMVRGVTERTRGDLTTFVQQHKLQDALTSLENKIAKG
jgi:translin